MFLAFSRTKKAEQGTHAVGEEGAQGDGGEPGEDEGEADGSYTWFGAKPPVHHCLLADAASFPRIFNDNSAATYIQKLHRARLAKKVVRKELCKTWCKKADTTPVSMNAHQVRLVCPFFLPARLKLNRLLVLTLAAQGIFYYENTDTGATQWVPPRLMQRLFPKLRW
jgi:hypothetical protein